MKKIYLLIVTVSLIAAQTNQELQNQIEQLKKEITKLKSEVKENRNDIDDGFDILDNVERKTLTDKINFSPALMMRFDQMNYTNKSIEGETNPERVGYTKNYNIASAIYFDLNMNAKLTKSVSFFGRLSFAYNSQAYQRLCILSRKIKSQPSEAEVEFSLAYFNYYINKSSILSIGMLPTFNGTPMQFAQNRPRESMFPALVFDMNTYGVIFTKQYKKAFFRFVAAKGYTLRQFFFPFQCNRENIDNATIIGAFSDISFELLGEDLFSFGINTLKDLKAHPYLGPDVTPSKSNILGDIYTVGIGLDSKEIFHSPLTAFLHIATSIPNGNGNQDDYKSDLNSTANYAKGVMLKHPGYALFTGIKYDINDNFDTGVEFNYGSKYWFAATQGSRDMYNKLAQRGHVIEVYADWLFHKNIFVKFGFLHMGEDYTGSGWHFGEPAKKDATNSIFYTKINIRF